MKIKFGRLNKVICILITLALLIGVFSFGITTVMAADDETEGTSGSESGTSESSDAGNETTDNETTGDETTGDGTTDNGTTGNETTDNGTTDNGTTGNETTGNETTGDETTGDETTGDETTGEQPLENPDDAQPQGAEIIHGDITGYVSFDNGTLRKTSATGTVLDHAGISFTGTTYVFTIKWSATDADASFIDGDYFTFEIKSYIDDMDVPSKTCPFANTTGFNIYDTKSGDVWGKVTIDSEGNGKVLLNDKVEGNKNISGAISFYATFTQTGAEQLVKWEFHFGNEVSVYEGTSPAKAASTETTGKSNSGVTYSDGNYKTGSFVQERIYAWTVRLNMAQDSWPGVCTVTDELPTGLKMTSFGSYSSASSDTYYYGFYSNDGTLVSSLGGGKPNRDSCYVAIALIDWESMRQDYSQLVSECKAAMADGAVPADTINLWVKNSSGDWTDSGYKLYELTSKNNYCTYMYDKMRTQRVSGSSGPYKYITPYLDGLNNVSFTDAGFSFDLPDGGLDGKSLQLYYLTHSTPDPPSTFVNTIKVSGGHDSSTSSSGVASKVYATVSGAPGEILIYKYDAGERNALSGAQFLLTKDDGTSYTSTLTNSAGNTIFNLKAPYDGDYTLTEIVAPEGFKTMSPITIKLNSYGEIVSNIDGEAGRLGGDMRVLYVYNSPVDAGDVTLTGTKTLTGANLTDGMFTFIVKDSGDNIVANGTNMADGHIAFSTISYTSAGDYAYRVSEVNDGQNGVTYDNREYTVNVKVTSDGSSLIATPSYPEGGIVFNNSCSVTPVPLPHDPSPSITIVTPIDPITPVIQVIPEAPVTNIQNITNVYLETASWDDDSNPNTNEFTPIGDTPVPLSDLPLIDIFSNDVPLGTLPKTGGRTGHDGTILAIAGIVLCLAAALIGRKSRKERA